MCFRFYDLNTKGKRKLQNCEDKPSKLFDCTMEFIVSKMNCSFEWDQKYHLENVSKCTSKSELKSYLDLRKRIYHKEYEQDLKHCFSSKCYQKYAKPELRFTYDEEILAKWNISNNVSILVFSKTSDKVIALIHIFSHHI